MRRRRSDWTIDTLRLYTERELLRLRDDVRELHTVTDRLGERVESLQRWRATVGGRTVVIVTLIALTAATLGFFVGHVLYR